MNIPIFLASNDNYAPFVATTMASICYNTKSHISFYVLDTGITEFHKKQIEILKSQFNNFTIEFLPVDVELYKKYAFGLKHISLDMYSRFFMFDLKPELQKAIYIDLDVVVLGDIAELYNEDLEGCPIGGIYCPLPHSRKFNYIYDIMGVSREHKYFNSGVLLFDNTKLSKNYSKDMFELVAKYSEVVRFGDQDTLNTYFNMNSKTLSIKYNYTNRHIQYKMLEKDIIVRHFEGSKKPWNSNRWFKGEKMQNFRDWWFFAEMTPFYAGLQTDFIASKIEEGLPKKSFIKKVKEKLKGVFCKNKFLLCLFFSLIFSNIAFSFEVKQYLSASGFLSTNEFWVENPNRTIVNYGLGVGYGVNFAPNFRMSLDVNVSENLGFKNCCHYYYTNALFNLIYDIPIEYNNIHPFFGILVGQQQIYKKAKVFERQTDSTNSRKKGGEEVVDYTSKNKTRGLVYGYLVGLSYKINNDYNLDFIYSMEQSEFLFSNPHKTTNMGGNIVETVDNYIYKIQIRHNF